MLLKLSFAHLFASIEKEQAAGFDLADADDVDEDEQCAEDAMEWFVEEVVGSHPTSHGEDNRSPAKVNDLVPVSIGPPLYPDAVYDTMLMGHMAYFLFGLHAHS